MVPFGCLTTKHNHFSLILNHMLHHISYGLGTYDQFREENMSMFECSSDSLIDSPSNLFRSSDRQRIIDFIIRSRIRDSGAELGENTRLGKEIEMRVPLHMRATLARLCDAWVTFWREENWSGRDGRSMTVIRAKRNSESLTNRDSTNHGRSSPSSVTTAAGSHGHNSAAPVRNHDGRVPNIIFRFILGSFYQPLDSIQQYFGEGVAFYFAWQQHCAVHLIFLSVFGLVVCSILLHFETWDHPIRPAFSFVIMIWSFVVMVTWRQRQNFLAHRWGTLNYQEEETTRPQFHGTYRQCQITNEWTIYYPSWKRWLKYMISFPLAIVFTVGTLMAFLIIFANRDNFMYRYAKHIDVLPFNFKLSVIWEAPTTASNWNFTSAQIREPPFWLINLGFPSLMALGLPLLNFLLMRLSVFLNEFENYRTESEYRNHLIIKVFAFRFVCYFSSLYYYSFRGASASSSEEQTEKIIFVVASMVMISITVSHWWNILVTIYFPLWFHRWRLYDHKQKLLEEIRMLERLEDEQLQADDAGIDAVGLRGQIKLANARILLQQAQSNIWEETTLPLHNSFHEYVYVVIQFAFVTCFSVILPIAPLISLLNHLWSMRLDAYKLCKGRRRPIVQKTSGIGVWEHVLNIVTVIGVLTNCALMAFTSEPFQWIQRHTSTLVLVIIVVAWEHAMLLIKYVMHSAISPMPKSVLDSLKKDRYERDLKRNYHVRAKKDRRSLKNPKKSASNTATKNSTTMQQRDIAPTDVTNLTRSRKVRIEGDTHSTLPFTQHGSLSTIPSLPNYTSEDSSIYVHDLQVSERDNVKSPEMARTRKKERQDPEISTAA